MPVPAWRVKKVPRVFKKIRKWRFKYRGITMDSFKYWIEEI